jgi:hypothetical protein
MKVLHVVVSGSEDNRIASVKNVELSTLDEQSQRMIQQMIDEEKEERRLKSFKHKFTTWWKSISYQRRGK